MLFLPKLSVYPTAHTYVHVIRTPECIFVKLWVFPKWQMFLFNKTLHSLSPIKTPTYFVYFSRCQTTLTMRICGSCPVYQRPTRPKTSRSKSHIGGFYTYIGLCASNDAFQTKVQALVWNYYSQIKFVNKPRFKCVIGPEIYKLLRGEVCNFPNLVWDILTNQDAVLWADGLSSETFTPPN